MSSHQMLAGQVLAESRLKGVVRNITQDASGLQQLYADHAGLTRSQRWTAKFLDAFPVNIGSVFLCFLVLMVGLNFGVQYIVNPPSAAKTAAYNAERLRLYEVIAVNSQSGGDAKALAAAISTSDDVERRLGRLESVRG